MSTIKIIPGQLESFANLNSPAMVVDDVGHVFGMFYPVLLSPELCPYSPEELERRRAEPGGRTTQEVLAELRRRFPE